jgi:tRNA1Val (adenine37-N6)-methyltransferase
LADSVAYTKDTLYRGRLSLEQPAHGYRFSVDAPLLARFAAYGGPYEHAVDLGAGCGAVGLSLAIMGAALRVTGVEIQPDLCEAFRRNVAGNGLSGRVEVVEEDLRRLDAALLPGSADLVVSNPPYFRAGSGPLNPNRALALARHEIACQLDDVVRVARRLVSAGGRIALILPADRLADAMARLEAHGMAANRLRMVHSHSNARPERALLSAQPGGGALDLDLDVERPLEVEPPLMLRASRSLAGAEGQSEEVSHIVEGRWP